MSGEIVMDGVDAETLLSNYKESLEEMKEEYESLMTEKLNLQLDMNRRKTNVTRLASDIKGLYQTEEEHELCKDSKEQSISPSDLAQEASDLINQAENDEDLLRTAKSLKYSHSLLAGESANLAAELKELTKTRT